LIIIYLPKNTSRIGKLNIFSSELYCLKSMGHGKKPFSVNLETGLPPVVGKEYSCTPKDLRTYLSRIVLVAYQLIKQTSNPARRFLLFPITASCYFVRKV